LWCCTLENKSNPSARSATVQSDKITRTLPLPIQNTHATTVIFTMQRQQHAPCNINSTQHPCDGDIWRGLFPQALTPSASLPQGRSAVFSHTCYVYSSAKVLERCSKHAQFLTTRSKLRARGRLQSIIRPIHRTSKLQYPCSCRGIACLCVPFCLSALLYPLPHPSLEQSLD
jgi:hypothetical protein